MQESHVSMSKREAALDARITDELEAIAAFAMSMRDAESIAYNRMVASGFWDRRRAIIKVLDAWDEGSPFKAGEGRRLILMEAIALITSELGEAVEGVRKGMQDQHLPQYESVTVELADAIIRILDLSGGLGLNVPQALFDKMEYNRTQRGKMHGKLS